MWKLFDNKPFKLPIYVLFLFVDIGLFLYHKINETTLSNVDIVNVVIKKKIFKIEEGVGINVPLAPKDMTTTTKIDISVPSSALPPENSFFETIKYSAETRINDALKKKQIKQSKLLNPKINPPIIAVREEKNKRVEKTNIDK